MNWEAISAIGQIVGAIAVVISLIYLATEIRSNARSARQLSLDSINRWAGQLVEHPDLAELYYRGIRDFRSLKSSDLVQFSALMGQVFFIFQELYYQQSDRHLDPRMRRGLETAMRDINAYPGVQTWWRFRSQSFGDEFANYVNHLQQTAKPPRLFREPMKDE